MSPSDDALIAYTHRHTVTVAQYHSVPLSLWQTVLQKNIFVRWLLLTVEWEDRTFQCHRQNH